jgi:hypothetical protein
MEPVKGVPIEDDITEVTDKGTVTEVVETTSDDDMPPYDPRIVQEAIEAVAEIFVKIERILTTAYEEKGETYFIPQIQGLRNATLIIDAAFPYPDPVMPPEFL